jgi:hypothetical protein
MTPKTAPWFVHYGCVPGLYPDSTFLLTASMLKPTQTPFIAGPLGVIILTLVTSLIIDFYLFGL